MSTKLKRPASFRHQGEILKATREALDMSQLELSEKLKLHVQCVSNWERGISEIPAERLDRMVKLLKLDWRELYYARQQDYIGIVNLKLQRMFKIIS